MKTIRLALPIALLLSGLVAGTGYGRATSGPSIRYAAPPDCPPAAVFADKVAQRMGANAGAPAYADGVVVSVEIVATPTGRTGTVRRFADGATTERRVFGMGRCDELADALAFTVALSLEATPPGRQNPGEEPLSLAADTTGPASANPNDVRSSNWAAGGGLGASGLLGPRTLATLALFFENRRPPERTESGLFLPDTRLTMTVARNGLISDDASVEFTVASASLDLCPLGARLPGAADARLCGLGELGLTWGRGIAVENPRADSIAWAAGGLLARLRFPLTDRLFLDLQAGAVVPSRRLTFVFAMPRMVLATSPVVAWTGSVNASWRIW